MSWDRDESNEINASKRTADGNTEKKENYSVPICYFNCSRTYSEDGDMNIPVL